VNTFGYVSGNPLVRIDVYGLAEVCRIGKINLHDHEGINGSHTISEHVGKSDSYLLRKMQGIKAGLFHTVYKPAHSTFSSVDSANRIVSAALAMNKLEIVEFLNSNRQQLVIHDRFSSPTGRVAHRQYRGYTNNPGPVQMSTGYGVTAVLRRNSGMSEGFNIYTAYPTR